MTAIILRRRRLGRGSANGICLASTTGIVPVRNWVNDATGPIDVMFRWGCTSSFPVAGVTVNSAPSIHWCADKRQGRLDMQAACVSVPETWASINDEEEWEGVGESWRVVVRKSNHAQGRDLYVPTDFRSFESLCDELGEGGYYISRLIDKTAEYRVFVCQGRVVWVAQKTPGNPDDVAWNVAQGGRFDNVRWGMWPMAVVEQALHAARVSGTDFSGVDVMEDAEGKAYVLEVNSAPSQTSPYRQQCVAKAFDWIVLNGKEHFPPVTHSSTWRDVLHPALINSSN